MLNYDENLRKMQGETIARLIRERDQALELRDSAVKNWRLMADSLEDTKFDYYTGCTPHKADRLYVETGLRQRAERSDLFTYGQGDARLDKTAANVIRELNDALTEARRYWHERNSQLEQERDRWKRQSDDWQKRGWEIGEENDRLVDRVNELKQELDDARFREAQANMALETNASRD